MQTTSPDRGVLGARVARTKFVLRKVAPSAELAPFVEYHWMVSWDLRGEPPFTQQVVPHPNVHLVFQAEGTRLYGVLRGRFTRTLTGRGQVLGVRFHPGGFRPWLGERVSSLTDRTVSATEFFGVAGTEEPVVSAPDEAGMVAAAEVFLGPFRPRPDPVVAQVRELVSGIAADVGLTRVDAVARSAGLTVRSLQRLFSEYVGVGPKWVIRRFRMHEAATRAEGGDGPDWAALAAELGYSDQAHFTREFTATIGVSPARYADRLPP
ncbi:DUF6597 domain-containing transcriptional factor [Actinokineospora sp.]|uniref:DUF6597 domain-containing transcriptional factor n=1 Tax=Actinokineospora sp. TaxID=1872133 RepID=UPI0040376E83